MSRNDPDQRRRRFLGTAAAAPLALLAGAPPAPAADPKLDPSSQQAKRFKYVHDASDASSGQRQEGANCANCVQWTGGDSQWGGCKIFPGKRVNRDGWCTAWVQA